MSSCAALATAYGVSGRSVAVSAIGYADESCAPYCSALPTTSARTPVAGASAASRRMAPSALISKARIGDALASGANALPARCTMRSGALMLTARCTLQTDVAERHLAQLAHRSRVSRSDHEVVRHVLLEHQPHRLDIVAGETPVASRFEGPEPDFLLLTEFDARHRVGDLARHELGAAPR